MNASDLAALVDEEVALNAFFHASADPLPIGVPLRARKTSRSSDPAERFIDQYRPPGAPPRWQTWYMTDDPCAPSELGAADTQYTYEVTPTTPPTPANVAWLEKDLIGFNRIVRMSQGKGWKSKTAAHDAASYWANTPTDPMKTEYLAPEIVVERRTRAKCGRAAKRKR